MAIQPGGIAVRATDLSMHYPAHRAKKRTDAVSGVSFDIAIGEILAVIGESGSGKSTLAAAVAGHAGLHSEPNAPVINGGSLRVLGSQVRSMSDRTRDRLQLKVGYLAQDAGSQLAPSLTVGENVAAPIYARDKRFDGHLAGQAVATLIDAVRLPLTTMNLYPYELSNGQRQRVAIARALILEPTLLVADNPTAGVDVTVRGSIIEIIRDVQQDREFSALVIADELGEVRRLGDRVMVMHQGLVAGQGTLDEILADPWHPYVEGLVRARELMTEAGA
jgi:ABC-type glutathione transport system ATPase component